MGRPAEVGCLVDALALRPEYAVDQVAPSSCWNARQDQAARHQAHADMQEKNKQRSIKFMMKMQEKSSLASSSCWDSREDQVA